MHCTKAVHRPPRNPAPLMVRLAARIADGILSPQYAFLFTNPDQRVMIMILMSRRRDQFRI